MLSSVRLLAFFKSALGRRCSFHGPRVAGTQEPATGFIKVTPAEYRVAGGKQSDFCPSRIDSGRQSGKSQRLPTIA